MWLESLMVELLHEGYSMPAGLKGEKIMHMHDLYLHPYLV